MPFSHSLLTLVAWGGLLGTITWILYDRRSGVIVGLLVVSHWALDWVSHPPDMQLFPGGARYGLGLWNSVVGTMVVESLMFAVGVALYFRKSRALDRAGTWGAISLVGVLGVAYLANAFGLPPPSTAAVAGSSLVMSVVLAVWASWSDRHRVDLAERRHERHHGQNAAGPRDHLAALRTSTRATLLRLGDLRLVARGVVSVDEPLAGGAVEKGRGRFLLFRCRGGGLGVLQGGPQRRALRAIAHGGCARLPHVLLSGRNSRHETISLADRSARTPCVGESRRLGGEGSKVKA